MTQGHLGSELTTDCYLFSLESQGYKEEGWSFYWAGFHLHRSGNKSNEVHHWMSWFQARKKCLSFISMEGDFFLLAYFQTFFILAYFPTCCLISSSEFTWRTLTRIMEFVTSPCSSCCLAAKERLIRVQATIPGRPLKNSLKSNHFPIRGLNSIPIM